VAVQDGVDQPLPALTLTVLSVPSEDRRAAGGGLVHLLGDPQRPSAPSRDRPSSSQTTVAPPPVPQRPAVVHRSAVGKRWTSYWPGGAA